MEHGSAKGGFFLSVGSIEEFAVLCLIIRNQPVNDTQIKGITESLRQSRERLTTAVEANKPVHDEA